jgi:hypothetical protein
LRTFHGRQGTQVIGRDGHIAGEVVGRGVEQQSPRVSSGDFGHRGRDIRISALREPAAARAGNPRRNGFDGPDTERRHRCSSGPLRQILVVGPCFTRPGRVRDVARIPPGTSLAQVESVLGRPALSPGSVIFQSARGEKGYLWTGPHVDQSSRSKGQRHGLDARHRYLDAPAGLTGKVNHASAPSRSSHLGAHLAFRTVPQPSTHQLDTVTEEQCAVCELPAVVTSTMSTSPHRATHRFAARGSWATKRWHRRSSLKRNHARVPWLLEFIRQY